MRRVGCKLFAPRQQRDLARDAFFFQQPGDDKTIAAIVTLAGNDQHTFFGGSGETLKDRRRDTRAGALHQRQARRRVFLDRQAIQLAHLCGGDNNHGYNFRS